MPIYEYRCEACGHELGALQGLHDELLTHCPECAGEHLRKRVSLTAFRLKGSGWYETDFKSGEKRNIAGDSSGGGGDGQSSGGEQSGGEKSGGSNGSGSGDSGGKSESSSGGSGQGTASTGSGAGKRGGKSSDS